MTYLAQPSSEMKPHYDVVIIGSGYGGSIAASRLARAGKSVCILERGREFQPGDYPDTLPKAMNEMQVRTADGHHGAQNGLYDFHVHEGISVLVGCGLGGTSLINANVSIRPEERVFDDPRWPAPLREEFDRADSDLNRGYERARAMLNAKPLPEQINLHKLDSLQKAAEANGEKFYRTDINVNFDINGENPYGVQQKPCNLCGDCCSGCNHFAKNTLIVNYLPDAKAWGAEIFTEVPVSFIERKPDRWHVHFDMAGTGQDKFASSTSFVEADIVVVAAGTLGSTEILLRSKEKGLSLSDKVGQSFSGNGDVLGFAYNTDVEVDGVGAGTHTPEEGAAAGPCITGVIDLRGKENLEEGMIIEDAAIPGPLAPLLPGAMAMNKTLLGKAEQQDDDHGLLETIRHKARIAESMIRGAYHGAIKHTQTYLMMTHDGEHGRMQLQNDQLRIDWSMVGREHIFQLADAQLRKETLALSGTYIKNPVWVKEMNNELVTVHPLGGCYMGESADQAVVNHKGQVYAQSAGDAVYDSLYVTDGSVMPRSLGVNPLLTICAVSERCAALIAQDRAWTIDYNSIKKIPRPAAQKPGVEFTETMRGFFQTGITNNQYQQGFDEGKQNNSPLEFTLTIRSEDVYDLIGNPAHQASIRGTVTAPALSARPMSVTAGTFQLFVDDPDSVNTKLMNYFMTLQSEEGKTYSFKGFKYVHHESGLDEWPDTSTLYITLREGEQTDSPILGQGILHILPADFEKQMQTMKALHAASSEEALKALADFGAYFARSLFNVYGGIAVPDQFADPTAQPRKKRPLRAPSPETYSVTTADGIQLVLTRYRGGSRGPLMMIHPFNGNRLNFSIDTIDTNLVEYFCAHGFDVWLLDNRLSSLLPSSAGEYTCDQIALNDYPAAVEKVRQVTGAAQVDVLAHCVGSITLFMSLLKGLQGVRSVISTQIATHFHPSEAVGLKSGLHLPQVLEALGVNSLNAFAQKAHNWMDGLYDKFVKLYAEDLAGYCTDPVCQRMTFMFGPLYEHSNLNDATHRANAEMWGRANMKTYEQLTAMIRTGHLVNAEGTDDYMSHIERLALPMTFIHGEKNRVFKPASTEETCEALKKANGPDLYHHVIVPGYGHNDCLYGKNAVNDVYPLMLRHFERFYPELKPQS